MSLEIRKIGGFPMSPWKLLMKPTDMSTPPIELGQMSHQDQIRYDQQHDDLKS